MGLSIEEIHRRYPRYAKTTLYRHTKQGVEVDVDDSRHKNPGRPRKTTFCDVCGSSMAMSITSAEKRVP